MSGGNVMQSNASLEGMTGKPQQQEKTGDRAHLGTSCEPLPALGPVDMNWTCVTACLIAPLHPACTELLGVVQTCCAPPLCTHLEARHAPSAHCWSHCHTHACNWPATGLSAGSPTALGSTQCRHDERFLRAECWFVVCAAHDSQMHTHGRQRNGDGANCRTP